MRCTLSNKNERSGVISSETEEAVVTYRQTLVCVGDTYRRQERIHFVNTQLYMY